MRKSSEELAFGDIAPGQSATTSAWGRDDVPRTLNRRRQEPFLRA
jgi:hypothetical protein